MVLCILASRDTSNARDDELVVYYVWRYDYLCASLLRIQGKT